MSKFGFSLPWELQTLRDTIRRFIREEVVAAERHLDPEATALPPDVLKRLQSKARDAGLWCLASPQEYGGAGLSIWAQAIVAEEASQHRMGAYNAAGGAFGGDPPNIMFAGTSPCGRSWRRCSP